MAQPVLMPQVGQDIQTAIVVEWKVKVGDAVKADDVIALVESDKATFEVEAFAEGVVLQLLLDEGQEGKVLEPIAYVGQPGEVVKITPGSDGASSVAPTESSEIEGSETEETVAPAERVAASPSARRAAADHALDISAIEGTGPNGRITKEDVLRAVEQKKDGPADSREQRKPRDGTREEPFSKMRRKIAERLSQSKQTIPHFYLYVDVDMACCQQKRAAFNEKTSTRISVTDVVVKAAAQALAEYPRLNGHVQEDRQILYEAINVGVAVAVEDGLIVPVVPGADEQDIEQISRIVCDNAEASRKGVMKPQAVGTFTVSNLGMCDVGMFLPIINPPECAILGVGSILSRPICDGESGVRSAQVMTLALACDHRVIDGVYAAGFLNEIKQQLENPEFL